MNNITYSLFAMQDLSYRDFHARLMPTIDKEKIIGVRTPELRKFAKKLAKEERQGAEKFMAKLPHKYYEENNLHGALIELLADTPAEALQMIDEFLPYVDNWATCDSLPPKIFKKDLKLVRRTVMPWLEAAETYRVRFAIVTMLGYLLDEEFEEGDLLKLANIETKEYYIKMAIAWYYSFALIKQYDAAVGLFEAKTLEKWTHNKSIQKAVESYRVPATRKEYLKTLRIKNR